MEHYVCIHGHFYQPPRENAWLETVELQDSAYPYHDWNQRITAECYAPNSVARILDDQNRIVQLVNNYARISFNFGPTLLQWLENNEAEVYEAIVTADRQSMANFAGHGSAIAQPYNHMIMPLANRRDRRTQVIWGIRDFERRFKRRPEGIWLPETAVDLETLEILAEEGIRFTILAPHQASRVRRTGARLWQDVTGAKIDPTRPYSQQLPSGKTIAIFFYDGPIARAVAFEGLLTRGEHFAGHAAGQPDRSARIIALKLLELQRHAMLMYTSCGWFFDELSGIETLQIIQYAARVVQLAEELFGESQESQFVEKLALAKSNLIDRGDGRHIYNELVRSSRVDWERIGAHYAVRSLFESYPDETSIYCYRAERENYQVFNAGTARLAVGRVKLTSEITRESSVMSFGVLHMGDHNVNGAVQESMRDELYQILLRELVDPFSRADFAEVIRVMDRCLGESNYSLRSLFREEQRNVLESVLGSALGQSETLYRQLYEQRAPIMRYLTDLHIPLPKAFTAAAAFVLNGDLRRALQETEINPERVITLLNAAKSEGIALD